MPLYRGINVKLHTPFLLQGLPEIPPTADISDHSPAKHFVEESRCRVSVVVPTMPQAHFWISYKVEEPPTEPEGVFYVFKLLVNGQPLVTWCCGEDEGWKGKTMFSLHDAGQDDAVGGAGMQKMCFHFHKPVESSEEDSPDKQDSQVPIEQEHCVEVRVCRANVKIRTPRTLEKCEQLPENSGIELRPGGVTKRGFPRTFYMFGLLDSMDAPLATFRFYYRTLDDFEALNLKMEQLDVNKADPICQASPASLKSEGSGKHWMAPSIKLERSKYGSISEQYFNYPSRAPGKKKRVSTNGDGSPQRITHCEGSPQLSPRRRPKGPRRDISKGTGGKPWVPPMPNIPSLPPPVPEHRTNIWQFGPSEAESTVETVETVYEEPKANPRRLSIPPSMVLRPLLAHGPLDASPTKVGSEVEVVSRMDKALPPSPRRRARAETGGMLKSVMANAVRRRNLTNPDIRRVG